MLRSLALLAPRRVLIVGGVAGGASTAARLRRLDKDAQITIFEKGGHVAFANCGLPYHVGDVIPNEKKLLLMTPTVLQHKFQIDVKTFCEVTGIDRVNRRIKFLDLKKNEKGEAEYDELVLAPGSQPLRPASVEGLSLPGVFSMASIPDARAIRSLIWNDSIRTATVVGSGFIGLEMTENLVRRGLKVHLVEKANQVFPLLDAEMSFLVEENLRRQKSVELHLNSGLESIHRDESPSPSSAVPPLLVRTANGACVSSDLVVLALGVRPRTDLARASGLRLGETGAIRVDSQMRTSDPHIYACGDAVEVENVVTGKSVCLPLAGPANREARVVAEAISGGERSFRGVQGTSVVGLFGQTIASTGLSERSARTLGVACRAIYIHNGQHAEYYPGSVPLHLKLLFDPSDGRVLGAQAVGSEGVEKRIDVISTMIQMKGSVRDLMEVELCYAPQFGSAKDPVNVLGMIATNAVDGTVKLADWSALSSNFILDVRNPGEVREGTISEGEVKNIPQCDVLLRLKEIPRDRPVFVLCREGYRAYCVLSQRGIDARLLSGGLHTYRMLHGESLHKGGAGCRPEGVGCCARAAQFA